MKVWVIEYQERVPPHVSMSLAVCSSRDKAIEWIKTYGPHNIDSDTDRFCLEVYDIDPTNDNLNPIELEYFDQYGNLVDY